MDTRSHAEHHVAHERHIGLPGFDMDITTTVTDRHEEIASSSAVSANEPMAGPSASNASPGASGRAAAQPAGAPSRPRAQSSTGQQDDDQDLWLPDSIKLARSIIACFCLRAIKLAGTLGYAFIVSLTSG